MRWAVLAALCVVLVALKAPLLNMDRLLEPDEAIYQTLAERLAESPPRYDLQGAHVLQYLSRTVYDRPLFYHPPLFAWLLRCSGFNMVLPLGCNVLTLLLTYWIAARLADEETGLWAAGFFACCPIAFWCAAHVWTDNLLLLTTTGGVAAMLLAVEREDPRWYALPGLLLGLSALSRLSGVLALLPMLAVYVRARKRPTPGAVAAFVVPAVMLVTPWLLELYRVYGTHVLADIRIPDAELAHFPFMMLARARPPWFYVLGLVMVAPLHLVSLGALTRVRGDVAAWPISIILALTVYGIGNTFQLRFIAPAMPGLCIAAALFLQRYPRAYRIPVLLLALIGLFDGWYCGVLHRQDGWGDVLPFWFPPNSGSTLF